MKAGDQIRHSQPAFKFLGVILDQELPFEQHLKYAATTAAH